VKVLVTGFEPFAGASLNPSGEIVKRLSGENLVTAVLPVTYEGATAELLRLVREHQPSAVVCLGQAEGRSTISFERVAINLDDASLADNAGVTRVDQPIDPSGPDACFTTLPVRELADAVKAAGLPASLSLSAGTFVCNHIFYELQKALAGTGVRSGFVHVPLMDEQAEEFVGKPTMPIADQTKAIQTFLALLHR
jgi:pyroglutamyl-peptidase